MAFVEHKSPGESLTPSREGCLSLDETSKLLLKAAAVIDERGWCQNEIGSRDGQVCLEGALYVAFYGKLAVNHYLESHPVTYEALCRIRKAVGMNAAFEWNDAPGRTKEEVVAKLRAVALGG